MKLLKMKIRGLGTTPETPWLDVGQGLTLFHLPDEQAGRAFARAIQTINPPYDCREEKPFSDLPTTIRYKDHTRVIQPHKRTISFGLFSSTPRLVKQLAGCSSLFYETDRIEVGRRLDYSLWINFVELASSIRWSEISEDIAELFAVWANSSPGSENLGSLIDRLRPTDRIKNDIMEQLERWLDDLASSVPEHSLDRIEELIDEVRRARHFGAARELIKDRLPFIFLIDPFQPHTPWPEISASISSHSGCPPFEFLINHLQRKLDGQYAGSNLGAATTAVINEELLRLDSKLRISFDPGKKIYRLEPGLAETGRINKDHSSYAEGLQGLHGGALFIIAAAKALTGSPPILLFHHGTPPSATASHFSIGRIVEVLATQCQCLCITAADSMLQLNGNVITHQCDDFA